MVGAISGLSLSQFWFGLMLMYLFALKLNWLPSFGYGDGGLRNLILPAIALGVGPMALLARTTRAAVLDVLNADFVRTARSKGMSERLVVKWHVLRNALVLVITIVGLQFGSLMGQAVVVEKLFAWPGVGSLMVNSVFQRDMPAVQGCILMIVLFFLVINTLVDLAYVADRSAHPVRLSPHEVGFQHLGGRQPGGDRHRRRHLRAVDRAHRSGDGRQPDERRAAAVAGSSRSAPTRRAATSIPASATARASRSPSASSARSATA